MSRRHKQVQNPPGTRKRLNRLRWAYEYRRLNRLHVPIRRDKPEKTQFRTLTASTPYFTATSIWRSSYHGSWACIQANPPLQWLVGKSPNAASLLLLKMNAQIRWSSPRRSLTETDEGRSLPVNATQQNGSTNSFTGITNPKDITSGKDAKAIVASPSLQTGAQPTDCGNLPASSSGHQSRPNPVTDALGTDNRYCAQPTTNKVTADASSAEIA